MLVPEVIEFSWVVFDVVSLQAVDEKQIYIKPQQEQPVTPECQHETGITDAMLEGAGTLQVCIQVKICRLPFQIFFVDKNFILASHRHFNGERLN